MNYIDELEREKAHSDQMKAAAQMWMDRALEAERTMAILVHAAGGAISVRRDHLHDAPRLSLERAYFEHDMTTRFRSRLAAAAPADQRP